MNTTSVVRPTGGINIPWVKYAPLITSAEAACHDQERTPLPENPDTAWFTENLYKLRLNCTFPFIFSSWYRTPAHNVMVATTGAEGPHTTGRAVDILIYGDRALRLIELAILWGMTGIGVKQHGPREDRFIHLDNLNDDETFGPRPWIWSYS